MPRQSRMQTGTNEPVHTAQLPLLYRDPVVLHPELHRTVTVSPSPGGYSFASEAHTVMLTAGEFLAACSDYPIVFFSAGDETVTPLVLLGMQAYENLFLDGADSWRASYIPAYIRRYPFIPVDAGSSELPICFDRSYDGLNLPGGQRLFNDQGEPTAYCLHVQAFLSDYQEQLQYTSVFTARLHSLGLFRPMDMNLHLLDSRNFQLRGFLIVDENVLLRIANEAVASDLLKTGCLNLIYAHLRSLKNLSRLIAMRAERDERSTTATAKGTHL